ncbi:hypothetical protein GS501_06845 [Saccharibacter sp. 17.LH.SD]|uniref:hypothetical protein n=1 Tax=Saccharibacter sp. 17.LH.SD TaxID=2689393 RepID=UPI001369AACA|nr:hypothetical protein [Saccharibacter sp. 17.LH.SD]MXV44752.1 hypothetical protein [Saccharibacter sp. 17.LH.SD]
MRHSSLITRSLPSLRYGWFAICAALSTLWLGLGFAALWGGQTLSASWEQRLDHTTFITVPTLDGRSTSNEHIATIMRAVSQLPGSDHVHFLSKAEINTLLAHWSATPWPDPVPAIITLHYNGDYRVLENAVHHLDTNTLILPPNPQSETLQPLLAVLKRGSSLIAGLCFMSGILSNLGALFLSLNTLSLRQDKNLSLLEKLGYPLSKFYRSRAIYFGGAALAGGLVGLGILFTLLTSISSLVRPFLHLTTQSQTWLTSTSITPLHIMVLLFLPFLQGIISALISHRRLLQATRSSL